MKNDKIAGMHENISSAKDAVLKIKRFENEKSQLEHQKISTTTIGKEDELRGIMIEYRYNNKWVCLPQK
jgi:hypothetical protein